MKQQGNFLLLEKDEVRDWLKQQNITRAINTLQVHHTWSPNYSTRKNQDPFKCLEGMRNSHLANGWNDIGQNITVLETGQVAISLGRGLNVTPAGISGANTKSLCVEIVANFDKGGDRITDVQKQSVIHLYACLCEKLNIPIDTDHIVYHAWFTSTGTRLSDYISGKSSKTCPGSNFFDEGNTIAAANKSFIPLIKQEFSNLTKVKVVEEVVKSFSKYFEDVDKDYQGASIDICKERGLISGKSSNTFAPNEPITRGDLAVVLTRLITSIQNGTLK